MKKFLLLLCLTSLSVIGFSQDAEKDVKRADKALGLYFLDPQANAEKLSEAKTLIESASMNEAVAGMYKTWYVKGKIFNEVANKESAMLQVNPNHKSKDLNAAFIAYESLVKALGLAVKGFEKTDVFKSLSETSLSLNSLGYHVYKSGDYKNAFQQFEAVLKINKLVVDAGKETILPKMEDYQNQLYITGLSAVNANEHASAIPYFEELRSKNYNNAAIWEGLYNAYTATKNETKAEEILTEGRTKYPDEASLLFAEINSYLKKGKLVELIDKLKLALQKEPNNASIYTTLGNVYDNLTQKAWEKEDLATADQNFAEALKYYNKANEIDSANFNAIYSIGALHYNQAAQAAKIVNKLANDYTKEGTKKYNEKKAEMDVIFSTALPYFEKAIRMEPKDVNTLTALKEIYARKNDFTKSNEMKARLDAIPTK